MYGYSDEPDIMEDMKDLHVKGLKKNVYMLVVEGEIRAATTKVDMEKYLASDDSIAKIDSMIDDVKLLYGLLLDPSCLPYDIEKSILANRKLYLIVEADKGKVDIEEYDTIEAVTEAIAELVNINELLEITDFVVFLAAEIGLVLAPAKCGETVTAYSVLGET